MSLTRELISSRALLGPEVTCIERPENNHKPQTNKQTNIKRQILDQDLHGLCVECNK